MPIYTHEVKIALGSADSWEWVPTVISYDCGSDMMEAADSFTLTMPLTRRMWELCKPDNAVNVFIDGTRVYSGYIDKRIRRLSKQDGSTVTIECRDKVGRLIDESAPLLQLSGLGIVDLAKRLAGDLFEIITSNATNRALIAGGRSKRTSNEPSIDKGHGKKFKPKKVDPGESAYQILQFFLEEAELMAWSTADGRFLVIGKPNYNQDALWSVYAASKGSPALQRHNVIDLEYVDSIAERYSQIIAVGSKPGTSQDFGPSVVKQLGQAVNGPGPDGIGKDFQRRKRLIVQDDSVHGLAGATARAKREMAERDSTARRVKVVMAGHGQVSSAGQRPSLFTFDTIASFTDEDLSIAEDWYVTAVRYQGDKEGGQRTVLEMVPRGTDLRMVAGGS